MTRSVEHFTAAFAAILIMIVTFVPVVTVPVSAADLSAAAPVLA